MGESQPPLPPPPQKQHPPARGRLVFCGHGPPGRDAVTLLLSDDGGRSWQRGGVLPSIPFGTPPQPRDFTPDECQVGAGKGGPPWGPRRLGGVQTSRGTSGCWGGSRGGFQVSLLGAGGGSRGGSQVSPLGGMSDV